MDKAEAIYHFWSSFGIPVYDENTVPDDAQLPYITYNTSLGDFPNTVALSASVWYRSNSWQDIHDKVKEISESFDNGAGIVKCDTGFLWVKKGNPFSQRMNGGESNIRRIYLSIEIDFITTN